MKNLKITSKLLMVNVELPIEIGQLKGTAIIDLHVYHNDDNSRGADVSYSDFIDITYMNVPIEGYGNWKKFLQFHKEMGIDFNTNICNIIDETFTEQFTNEFIKDIEF